jgi:hypothetical protein
VCVVEASFEALQGSNEEALMQQMLRCHCQRKWEQPDWRIEKQKA